MAKKQGRITPSTDPRALGYAPTRKYKVDPFAESVIQLIEKLPNGVFAILCNENARYTAFYGSLTSLILPIRSGISFHTGAYVVDSSNRAVLGMPDHADWICFMGDDHVFPPEFVIRLLTLMYAHDYDIIVPVCFKRSFPPIPVLYNWGREDHGNDPNLLIPLDLNEHPNGGLVEVYACGSAGMIVRRRVFEKMQKEGATPYFELGEGGGWGEDLYFCHKAQQLGFRVWADLDTSLGHILNTAIWPVRHEKGGKWGVQYDFNTQGGFILALDDQEEYRQPPRVGAEFL